MRVFVSSLCYEAVAKAQRLHCSGCSGDSVFFTHNHCIFTYKSLPCGIKWIVFCVSGRPGKTGFAYNMCPEGVTVKVKNSNHM